MTKYLIDTHILIFYFTDKSKLTKWQNETIDLNTEIYVSTITFFEMATLIRLKKIDLGMTISAKQNFNVNFDKVKNTFYRSFNAIYSKSKFANSELISINLMKSFCVPVITYGIESLHLSNRDRLKLDKT